jgi:hypothetical protein
MKQKLLTSFFVAFIAEIINLTRIWILAPTDGLRVKFDGSFVNYVGDRIAPWFLILVVVIGIWSLVEKLIDKRPYTFK